MSFGINRGSHSSSVDDDVLKLLLDKAEKQGKTKITVDLPSWWKEDDAVGQIFDWKIMGYYENRDYDDHY